MLVEKEKKIYRFNDFQSRIFDYNSNPEFLNLSEALFV